jgi:hypothetical protein
LPSEATATAECSSWVRPELFGGLAPAGGLAEQARTQRQRLIGAHDKMGRPLQRHQARLLARQQKGDVARRGKAGLALDGAFVEIGRHGLDGDAGIVQQHPPGAALRRQDQGMRSAPQRHRDRITREAAAAAGRYTI